MIVGHIGGGSVGGYQVQRSVRLRSSASAYLNRTPASDGNRRTWTWSGWVKRGALGTRQSFLHVGTTSAAGNFGNFGFNANDQFDLEVWSGAVLETTMVFRDVSAWYHIVLAVDTTQASASDRVKLYVNGTQVTSFATNTISTYYTQNYDTAINRAAQHSISSRNPYSGDWFFDGYHAEINFIDGQALTPTSFAEQDSTTRMWVPKKYTGSFGTNGFYLDFSDITSTTTLGYDKSGNGNNWTANNISLTSGSTYDSMLDVPGLPWTDGGNGRGNYATLNPLNGAGSLSEANLKVLTVVGDNAGRYATMPIPSSGKWYWEFMQTLFYYGDGCMSGIADASLSNRVLYFGYDGTKNVNGTYTSYGAAYGNNVLIGVAVDADAGQITFYRNNVSQGVISFSLAGKEMFPWFNDGSGGWQSEIAVNFGQRPFAYTPPTGFKALNTANLPDPTGAAAKPWEHHHVVTITKSGNTNFTLPWNATDYDTLFEIKRRDAAGSWYQVDGLRGYDKYLSSNSTAAETTDANVIGVSGTTITLKSTLADGTYVVSAWKAGLASARQTNTSGSITSTVSVNTDAGFSIVDFDGNGTGGTVGHGLGLAPEMIEWYPRGTVANKIVGHKGLNNGSSAWNYYLAINSANGQSASSSLWNNTAPTSTVVTVGVNATSGSRHVMYCFSSQPGYSKFDRYAANGSSEGPSPYLGFFAFDVMFKAASGTAYDWAIYDVARDTYNIMSKQLAANSSAAEGSYSNVDFLSNGFKVRGNNNINESGANVIFRAFSYAHIKYANAR